MQQREHAFAPYVECVPHSKSLAIRLLLSVVLLVGTVVSAALGALPETPAMLASALAAVLAMECMVGATPVPRETSVQTRLALAALAAFLGALLVMIAGVLDPNREIKPEEYGAIARTVDQQPYAAPLLTKARADGIVTNEEQDAFHRRLRSLERERVLMGVIDDMTPIRRS